MQTIFIMEDGMFLKILKRDLKRKKAMNVILFIFMLTASILIAGSTNLMYSTLTAVDYFIQKSKVADVISLTFYDQKVIDAIDGWSRESRIVSGYEKEDAVIIDEKKLTASTGKLLKNTGVLVIMRKPQKYNLIFDKEGENFEVRPSQAAVPVSIQKKLGLSVGDRLTVEVNGYQKELTISCIFKDAVFGSEIMSYKRIILNDTDFADLYENSTEKEQLNLWGMSKADGYTDKDLSKDFSSLSLPTETIMTKDEMGTVYLFDMLMAAIMILISIFLILISFLILRFTIVFTVTEDYKQIGVMKAIGLKSRNIRKLYSVKYFALSAVAGLAGFIASLPASGLMKKNIGEYILLKETRLNLIIAIFSVIAVILITVLFCNLTAGRIRKISAIDAIRQGNTGERFKNTKKLKLHRRKRMRLPMFLALNDIVSDLRKFIILIITFILGTAIIIIPNNIITTLSSDKTITLFGFSDSDFYIRDDFLGNQQEAIRRMEELKREFEAKGFDVKLRADLNTNGKIDTGDQSDRIVVLSFQGIGIKTEEFDYLEGSAPVLPNEIAVTEKVADALDIGIGDRVECEVQNISKEYIVTALFQSFNNLGNNVRMPEKYSAEEGTATSITISGCFTGTAKEKNEQFNKLKEAFPELAIRTGKEVVSSFIGNLTDQIGLLKNSILLLVVGINFLITTLLLRMLISKEVPEIAILKSIGFHNRAVRGWQIIRLGIVLAVSILIGTVLANTTGNIVSAGVFETMGVTRLKLMIEPLEVYLIYPVLLYVITMLAVVLSLGQVKATHVWELNNQE